MMLKQNRTLFHKMDEFLRRSDYYFAFMCVVTWTNWLQLEFLGIKFNILLYPFLLWGFAREVACLVKFCKERSDANWFINLVNFVFMSIGILPWPGEKRITKTQQIILRSIRILYSYFVISTFVYMIRVKSFTKHSMIQIIIFYFLMISLPRLSSNISTPDLKRKMTREIQACMYTIFVVGGLTAFIDIFMLILNYQNVSGAIVIGVYGKGLLGVMANPNSTGIFSGIASIAAIYTLFQTKRKWLKIIAGVNLCFQLIVVVFCNSRTSLLALMLTYVMTLLFFAIKGVKFNVRLIAVLVVSVMLTLLISTTIKPYAQANYLKEHLDTKFHKKASDLLKFPDKKSLEEREKMIKELDEEDRHEPKQVTVNKYIFGKKYPLSAKDVYIESPLLINLDNYLTGRVQLWNEAVLLFGSNKVIGYGFYRLNTAFIKEVSYHGNVVYMGISSSHNIIFDLFWMGGIIGATIGFVFLISNFFYLLYRMKKSVGNRYRLKSLSNKVVSQKDTILLLTMVLLGMFLLIAQMFEISSLTAFNISTLLFWLFARWNAAILVGET